MSEYVRFEGVTFVVAECRKMTKAQFIKAHVSAFWTDRDEAVRKEMLTEAYNLIAPPDKKK